MKGNPRYAIVRVDKDYYLNSCPAGFEEINNDFVCSYKESKTYSISINCKKCRYGDTKEQLIRKVAQVLFKERLEIYKKVYGIIPNDKFMKETYIKQLKVAKKIVEFLGVK